MLSVVASWRRFRGKIIEKGKRNAVSRLLHAKNDKEVIATWKSDLSKILLIFNVSSVVVLRLLLTVHSDRACDKYTTPPFPTYVTTLRRSSGIVSNVQNGVTSTHNMVSDIHHIITKSQGAFMVPICQCTLSINECTLMVA
jgi:hypothetical protein